MKNKFYWTSHRDERRKIWQDKIDNHNKVTKTFEMIAKIKQAEYESANKGLTKRIKEVIKLERQLYYVDHERFKNPLGE